MKLGEILRTEIDFSFGATRSSVIAASGFLVSLFLFESVYLHAGLSQWWRVVPSDTISDVLVASLFVAVSSYFFFALILLAIAGRPLIRVISISVFAVVTAVEYSYQGSLGRFTNSIDVATVFSVNSEQTYGAIFEFTSFLWLIPTVALVLTGFILPERSKLVGWASLTSWFIGSTAFYLLFFLLSPILFGCDLSSSSFDAFSQSLVDYAMTKEPPPREAVERVAGRKPQNNVVLIFDESMRGDHLSINGYPRATTPSLESLAKEKRLINWGIASSESTSSKPSFDFFVMGATPEMLDADLSSETRLPSIFQYAKAMGYETYMLDGQMPRYWFGIQDDLNYIDHFRGLDNFEANWVRDSTNGGADVQRKLQIDPELASITNQIISGSTGNFIFVYKRGNHFPYEDNFQGDSALWTPIYRFSFFHGWQTPKPEARDALINSYDNGVRYDLERFFAGLAQDYSKLPNNTVIFYTSDHGEDLRADGKAPHGGSTVDEATVPLFALGLDPNSVDTSFKASHANLFTTLLDLMGVPESARKYPYAISLLKAKGSDSRPRFFNMPDGRKIPFDK